MSIIGIGIAALAGMALGALWYSPLLFGNAWMAALGKTEEDLGSPTAPMLGSMAACLLTAIALAYITSIAGISTIVEGLTLGAIIGIGIIFPAMLSDSLFCGWGNRLLMIQSGYRILYAIVMCGILAAF